MTHPFTQGRILNLQVLYIHHLFIHGKKVILWVVFNMDFINPYGKHFILDLIKP